ncbi:MAG: hypothetical protein NVS4B12_15160 [Ktedonobacteraceae bacterium]
MTPAHYTVDITVPRSRLRDILTLVDPICEKYNLRVGHLMHAGDGNLHPMVLVPNPDDPELMKRVHAAGREMVACCVEMGGSLTGEHGVGIEKREFMTLMHNDAELLALWDVKQAFDPHDLLNPGKVFPSPAEGAKPFVEYGQQKSTTIVATMLPGTIFAPSTAEEAAQGLLALSHAQQQVRISNAASETTDGILTTRALRGIKTFAPDDLYITVGAGTPLAEIQAFLAERGKSLPLASPWPDTTLGGLVATNGNAPLRMRYGSIRDLVLCATVALADGRVIRTGRPIVKNVAGYDLTKVFVGSHGTLGLLTDITLKFFSQPRAKRTLLFPGENLQQVLSLAKALLPLALTASAILLCKDSSSATIQSAYTLIYTAEGLAEDVEAELDQVRDRARSAGATTYAVDITGTDLWRQELATGTVLRVGVPAKDLFAYLQENIAALNESRYIADMSSGCLYAVKTTGQNAEIRAWITTLRQPALAYEGYAVVMKRAEGVLNSEQEDYQPQALDVMKRLKQRWDPVGILA